MNNGQFNMMQNNQMNNINHQNNMLNNGMNHGYNQMNNQMNFNNYNNNMMMNNQNMPMNQNMMMNNQNMPVNRNMQMNNQSMMMNNQNMPMNQNMMNNQNKIMNNNGMIMNNNMMNNNMMMNNQNRMMNNNNVMNNNNMMMNNQNSMMNNQNMQMTQNMMMQQNMLMKQNLMMNQKLLMYKNMQNMMMYNQLLNMKNQQNLQHQMNQILNQCDNQSNNNVVQELQIPEKQETEEERKQREEAEKKNAALDDVTKEQQAQKQNFENLQPPQNIKYDEVDPTFMESFISDTELFCGSGHNLTGKWAHGESRGGRPYNPPDGWIGFGLNVINKYDNGNNDWLACDGRPGEWCVAYHGACVRNTSDQIKQIIKPILQNNLRPGAGQAYASYNDDNHPGQKVGKGVYCTPNASTADGYAGKITVNGYTYKVAFMLRVKPDKIRYSNSCPDYWVLNAGDGNFSEMRPYRFLIKKC